MRIWIHSRNSVGERHRFIWTDFRAGKWAMRLRNWAASSGRVVVLARSLGFALSPRTDYV